jgi:TPR repeat protein
MVKQAPQYRSGDPDVDAFDENTADHRVAPYKLRQSPQTDIYPENSVPLFLSDDDGELKPSEYVTPLLKKRRASISSRILAVVCAAAAVAVLVALFSSDAARDIAMNVKASMAPDFPVQSVAGQSDPSQLTARDRQKDLARPSATENQTPGVGSVTTAAAASAREEIKIAYQSALQGRAPAAAAVAEPTTPGDAVHHLDPDVIAALLRRADALIASGDVAAARLVLRRAADAGDARAAMTLGGTYDPAILEKLGVHGFMPDVAMARSWYEKAKKFGSAEAPQRLEMLASRRQ